MEGSTVLKHLKSFSWICPDICACWGSIEVVVPLQKGSNGSSDNLRIIEMNMMGSWNCSVFVQRVGAVRLHCGPVQLLCIPSLRLRLCKKTWEVARFDEVWEFGASVIFWTLPIAVINVKIPWWEDEDTGCSCRTREGSQVDNRREESPGTFCPLYIANHPQPEKKLPDVKIWPTSATSLAPLWSMILALSPVTLSFPCMKVELSKSLFSASSNVG